MNDAIELHPPTAQQVAQRALILAAVVCRGFIDGGSADPEAQQLLARIKSWLRRGRLLDHSERSETEILRAELGQLQKGQAHRAAWAVEGLAVLSWALGRYQFPAHDEQVDPYAVTDSVGFLAEDTESFLAAAQLRSADELDACRELMYAIHCRLRDFVRNRSCEDFSTWVEPDWLRALSIDESHLMVNGDLAVGGNSIADVSPHAVENCEWIISERHRASIWLIGEESPSYWDWPVDT